jgi:hypothetical protein
MKLQAEQTRLRDLTLDVDTLSESGSAADVAMMLKSQQQVLKCLRNCKPRTSSVTPPPPPSAPAAHSSAFQRENAARGEYASSGGEVGPAHATGHQLNPKPRTGLLW